MKTEELERGDPSWGILTAEQKLVVKSFIRGRRIRDYGCGNLVLTKQLLELGARHIEGVDVHRVRVPKDLEPRLKVIYHFFHECPPSARMAFMSWPVNGESGIEVALRQHTIIIYLGKNTDGRVCGSLKMWRELRRRRILAHVPAPQNDLIVYGGAALRKRRLLPEEFAGCCKDRVYKHDEVHRPGFKLGTTARKETLWDLVLEAIGL